MLFKDKANGSIIEVNGVKYGSALLAQQFTGDEYLWGRPMMLNTETFYDKDGKPLLYAGASNKTPAGEELEQMVKERTKQMQDAHPDKKGEPVPVDLVTVSGSGLDPHISLSRCRISTGAGSKGKKYEHGGPAENHRQIHD